MFAHNNIVFGNNGALDPDAESFIQRVQQADGQSLELSVIRAYNDFVSGCKIDGLFDRFTTCFILAGARTLSGCLVPLVGPSPTNIGFTPSDYSRQLGPLGDGNKHIVTNRNNQNELQNDNHIAAWASTGEFTPIGFGNPSIFGTDGDQTTGRKHIGIDRIASNMYFMRNSSFNSQGPGAISVGAGFHGMNRSSAEGWDYIIRGFSGYINQLSDGNTSSPLWIFGRSPSPTRWRGRISFFSAGRSLNLSALNRRVSNLTVALTNI